MLCPEPSSIHLTGSYQAVPCQKFGKGILTNSFHFQPGSMHILKGFDSLHIHYTHANAYPKAPNMKVRLGWQPIWFEDRLKTRSGHTQKYKQIGGDVV